jgi:hypothetical protein
MENRRDIPLKSKNQGVGESIKYNKKSAPRFGALSKNQE